MAAAEYYLGSQGAQQYHSQQQPAPYPSQQPQYQQQQPSVQPWPRQQYNTSPYASTPPPSYSPYAPQQQNQQLQASPSLPPQHLQQQYPGKGYQEVAVPYLTSPTQQSNGYLGPPLQHIRSHSQPAARVRFADQESTALGSETESESDTSRRRRHRHHRNRDRTRHHDHSGDLDRESDYSDRDYDHPHSRRTKAHQKKHENRDTFLGAGAGSIIGDAIFPGLGTAAGLLIGGLGGRKYAKDKRSHSEEGQPHRHRDTHREGRDDGREDREYGRHRHHDVYHESKEDRRRDRVKDSGYEFDGRDSRNDFNTHEEELKQRGKHRK